MATTDTARSIVREIVTRSYTRYTPSNGKRPDGTEYGVDGWLFELPGETLNKMRFLPHTYAAYQVHHHGMLFWQVREVGGKRRQVGSQSTSRKGALALAVQAVANKREREAARATQACQSTKTPCPTPGQHQAAPSPCDAINQDAAAPVTSRGPAARDAARPHTDSGTHERPGVTPTEAERLKRAAAGELSSRPVTAEIAIGYPLAGGGATLRLYNANGNQVDAVSLTDAPRHTRTPDPLKRHAGEITHGAMTEGLMTAAGYILALRGFNYGQADQWRPYPGNQAQRESRREWEFASSEYTTDGTAPYAARISLTPAAGYLAYLEASYGPAPVLTDIAEIPDGWRIRSVQRGWWEITTGARRFAITWQPMIGREVWCVRNEDHPDAAAERFNSSHPDASAAVDALVKPLNA
ncbi:hypothetical protein ACWCQP_36780 [Streptomyces chartreusis]